VTNALAELESMFGTPLFERSPRGMLPTALGAVVLERAKAMISDLDHLAREMEVVAAGHAAHLHIGVIPFISGQMLSAALKRLQAQMERRVTVTIHEGTSDQLLPQLKDHVVDIVIARASSAVDLTRVSFEVLYQQQPRIIASRRLAAKLARTKLDWNKLRTLDWILGAPNTPMREQVTDLFLSAGIAPPVPVIESYSSKLIGEMIASGEEAISIVPVDIAEELVRIAGVAIVPYSLSWTLPPIAVFTRVEKAHAPARDVLIEVLRQVCRETYGGGRE
jgi:DNA-binding transcriptional LysR family regulator